MNYCLFPAASPAVPPPTHTYALVEKNVKPDYDAKIEFFFLMFGHHFILSSLCCALFWSFWKQALFSFFRYF